MTDITELAQSLKAAAENATPGEWCSDDQYGIVADAGLNGNYYIASCSGPEHRQNKRFIALANPANVIALVEALEELRAQIDRQEDFILEQDHLIGSLKSNLQTSMQRVTWLEESHKQVIHARDHYKALWRESVADAEPVVISDCMAYAFHHAMSDSSLGADEVEEIKTGLRAAFANAAPQLAKPRTVTVKQFDEFQICHYGATEDYAKGYIDCQNNFFKWLTAAGIKWEAE